MNAPLALPAELTIYTVSELLPPCQAWLDAEAADSDAPQVDAQAVQEVDAAGVQLLLSLSLTLNARGQRLKLLQASDSLVSACAALGAESLLAAAEPEGARA